MLHKRAGEYLVLLGSDRRGVGSKYPRRYYALFHADNSYEYVTLTQPPPTHLTVLRGQEARVFLRDRNFVIRNKYLDRPKRKVKK